MPPLPLPLAVTLCTLTVCAAAGDLRARRIGNPFNAGALCSALILHLLSAPVPAAFAAWLGGAATGLLLFLPLYALRGMAAGDVKLMAAVGAFAGSALAFRIALGAALAGGAIALFMAARAGTLAITFHNVRELLTGAPGAGRRTPHDRAGTLPYGAAICVATLAVCAGA